MKLIDKAALVAEIEKRIKEIDEIGTYLSPKGVLTNLLCHLDTLEVKEVDLEEDIEDFINEEYRYSEYEGKWINEKDWQDSIQRCAKHFFELGIKAAQKGE